MHTTGNCQKTESAESTSAGGPTIVGVSPDNSMMSLLEQLLASIILEIGI